jgi:large subunit ribosomal protein L21
VGPARPRATARDPLGPPRRTGAHAQRPDRGGHDQAPPAHEESTVFAVIATGGKQYRVIEGQNVTVEKLDVAVGDSVDIPAVMVVDDEGAVTAGPDLSGRTVSATVTDHFRGDKIRVFTYKNKSRQHKRRGHRQAQTTITIDSI